MSNPDDHWSEMREMGRRQAESMVNVAPQEPDAERDERHARERLGRWLAAEPGRTWEYYPSENTVRVCSGMQAWPGTGPTLAVAICNALDNVSG